MIGFSNGYSNGATAGMGFGGSVGNGFLKFQGYGTRPYPTASGVSGYNPHYVNFNASWASSVYKDDCNTVQPKSYTVIYIMRIS